MLIFSLTIQITMIFDIDIPNVNGFDIAEQISSKSNTITIFVTTYPEILHDNIF